jgi:hypothetical protein
MQSDFNAQRRAQLLIERVADYAIYMLNPDGTVASWNAGARRFSPAASKTKAGACARTAPSSGPRS